MEIINYSSYGGTDGIIQHKSSAIKNLGFDKEDFNCQWVMNDDTGDMDLRNSLYDQNVLDLFWIEFL